MKLIRHLNDIPTGARQGVATLGCFDGVHLGHQVLLKQVVAQAQALRCASWVISFEPYPVAFFKQADAPLRLTSCREKYQLLKKLGITHLLCLRFNTALAAMSADRFVQEVLLNHLKLKHFIVGQDCRFGQDQQGDLASLQHYSDAHTYALTVLSDVCTDTKRISSTQVRQALNQGDLQEVTALLGRYYSLSGRVIHGAQRGRQMGFPTANLPLPASFLACRGVFVVRVQTDNQAYQGVANVGCRPTLGGNTVLLEVHLFNFKGSLYGKRLRVEFVHKLRKEKKFESLEALQQQIRKDVAQATQYFIERKRDHSVMSSA